MRSSSRLLRLSLAAAIILLIMVSWFIGRSTTSAQSDTAPEQPSGLSTEAGDTQVRLSWEDPDDSTIDKYELWQIAESATLTAANNEFGYSVAVAGDIAVIGMPDDDESGPDSGAALVFSRVDGVWTQKYQLRTGDDAGVVKDDGFGSSIAFDGETIVVGAPFDDSKKGAAYLFVKPDDGWDNPNGTDPVDLTDPAKLTAPNAAVEDEFGYSVAMDGNTVVVGAYSDDSTDTDGNPVANSGSAYVFTKPGNAWVSTSTAATLTASDAAAGDEFGSSVAVDGNTIVVGASGDDGDALEFTGSAFVFVKPNGGWVSTSTAAKLIAYTRGDDSQPTSEQRAWFSRAAIGVPAGPHHISFPYHSGDIVWATEDDSIQMRVTVQDPDGQITVLLEERAHLSSTEGPGIQQRRVTGDLPLILSTNSGLEATFAVDAIDQWGYAYRAVERPGVRVRESIGTDATKSPYWRFNDRYLAQRGMGSDGDLPNDIKWQFGAAVFKRPDLGIGEVAIYGSLWVEIAKQDPVGSRVFPPFQGAAGGPSGGPIMTLKGQEIDLFVLPTGVRPGTILEVGDRFVFAGQVGPPLASKVTVRVTSPSGRVREISGQANPIGYFSDPAGDFVVEESGLWTVEVQVVHDGVTSAGPVEPPYPTGGVLGSADGRFQVYVVPMGATQLDFGLSAFGIYALPSSIQMLFFPGIPEGWADVTGVYTITMPGFILEEGSLTLQGGVFELVYDPVRLSQEFLNIDLASRHGFGAGLADEVFISVMLTGTDASGQRVHAAKLLTLVGEDIYDLN